jgi:hypothetical protein
LFTDKIANKFFILVWTSRSIATSASCISHSKTHTSHQLAALILFYLEIFIPVSEQEGSQKVFKGSHIWLDFAANVASRRVTRDMGFIVSGCRTT